MTTTQLTLSIASHDDAAALSKISTDTFFETFERFNTKEDMEAYLLQNFTTDRLHEELADPASQFVMALCEGMLAGYMKLRRSDPPAELATQPALEIERLYVSKPYQSKKVGAALMQHAIDTARSEGSKALWLGVWEHNPKAIAFYERWGFKTFGSHGFQLGSDLQTDLLMKLML